MAVDHHFHMDCLGRRIVCWGTSNVKMVFAYRALQDAHQEVTAARDKYYLQLEELEHRSTPR